MERMPSVPCYVRIEHLSLGLPTGSNASKQALGNRYTFGEGALQELAVAGESHSACNPVINGFTRVSTMPPSSSRHHSTLQRVKSA